MANPGILHKYYENLVAFEHAPPSPETKYSSRVILFIGGLGDGLTTVPYTKPLSDYLYKHNGWGVIELLKSTSYEGWGHGSLTQDSIEIEQAVKYLRTTAKKTHVIILGHSTGTQNAVHYTAISGDKKSQIDGIILQASVSDREAFVKLNGIEKWKESLAIGKEILEKDKKQQHLLSSSSSNNNDIINYSPIPSEYTSLFFGAPINSYRWVSLLDVRGDDDFFSSDLDDILDYKEKTFGQIKVPILVLFSGADEFVLDSIDKYSLVKRFQNASNNQLWSPYSHVVENATHNLANVPQETLDDLISSVSKFVDSIN